MTVRTTGALRGVQLWQEVIRHSGPRTPHRAQRSPRAAAERAGACARWNRLYYHLRILKARRLIAEYDSPGPARVQAIADAGDAPLRVRYEPESRANAAAVGRVVGSMLREALRSFRRAFRPGVVVEGPRRSLWVGRRTAWLTGEELEEANARLESLVGYLTERRGRKPEGRLYSFTFAISPFGGGRRGGARAGQARP